MKDLLLKYALQNAIKFDGKPNPGAVIGMIIGQKPELKAGIQDVQRQLKEIIADISKMSVEQQTEMLRKIAPELLEKKEQKERDIFSSVQIDSAKDIITAFPPGPEKYPHLGHAKAILLNHELARRNNGRFILRFEDTNPALVKKEFYEIMLDNFSWLGVTWDELIYASDHMELFYKHAEDLIRRGEAYMCFCSSEEMSQSRQKGVSCACRDKQPEVNLDEWKAFAGYEPGKAALRLKIDLNHKNSTMRDPTIFRIISQEHARHGNKYRVWPNYDFQNSIMDGYSKISNRIRSKEFEMRDELQAYIQTLLGYGNTKITSIGRLNLTGVESSGRKIREKIDAGELLGWDDPTLTTLVALKRRGFRPQALKSFVLASGLSKADATITWDDLIMHNKRLLDSDADRYFFIRDPVKVRIKGAPKTSVSLKVHPEFPQRGTRELITGEEFFITKTDYANIKDGSLIRLMDCINFRKVGDSLTYEPGGIDEFRKEGRMIIHYLPVMEKLVKAKIMMPDKQIVEGLAEPSVSELAQGEIIQFERFGFCRLDSKEDMMFWFTH